MLIMHRKMIVTNIFVEIDAYSVLEQNVPLCTSTLVEKFVPMRVKGAGIWAASPICFHMRVIYLSVTFVHVCKTAVFKLSIREFTSNKICIAPLK